jgi:hypothetical protein
MNEGGVLALVGAVLIGVAGYRWYAAAEPFFSPVYWTGLALFLGGEVVGVCVNIAKVLTRIQREAEAARAVIDRAD